MCEARKGGDQYVIGQPNDLTDFIDRATYEIKHVFTHFCLPKEVSLTYQQPESFIHIIRHITSLTCKRNLLY